MITGITFNHDSSCIAVTSDTETIHFFPVPEQFKWENNLIQSTMDESVKQEEVNESTPEDLTEMEPIPTILKKFTGRSGHSNVVNLVALNSTPWTPIFGAS